MNVLMISLDTTFLAEPGKARSDTLSRHKEIAELLSRLHVIVFSVGKAHAPSLRPSHKLTLYPSQSVNKAMRVLDALRIGVRICRRNRIDVITTQDAFFTGMVGLALWRLFRIPLNVQVHADCLGNPFWIRERSLNRFLNVSGGYILRRANNVRVVSASEKKKMMRLDIPSDRIWNIPGGGGIDIEKFFSADGSSIRKKLLPEGCERIVLFAGRVTEQKRIPDLLLAAKKVVQTLPNVCFVIAGEGRDLPAATRLAAKLALGDRVIFAGNVPYDQMPAYFAAADAFALPSGYEGTARVLMESVAAGLPIVTTKVSGVSELVSNGENGFVVSVGRPSAMAKRLIEVLSGIERFRQGAERQKVALKLFDRRRNFPRLVEMWSQVARKGNGT